MRQRSAISFVLRCCVGKLEEQCFGGKDNCPDDNDDKGNADNVAADVSCAPFFNERFAHFSLAFHDDGAALAFRSAAAHIRLPGAVRFDNLRNGLFAKVDFRADSLGEH